MIRRWTATGGLVVMVLAGLASLTACTTTQKGAGIGAASGALLGAIIGHQSDHRTEGALVGAAVGGLAGALVGDGIDEHRDRRRDREQHATREELWQRIDLLEQENRQLRENRPTLRTDHEDEPVMFSVPEGGA